MPILAAHQIDLSVFSSHEGALWNKNPQQSSQLLWVTVRNNRGTLCLHMHSQPVAGYFNSKAPSVIRNNRQEESENLERS